MADQLGFILFGDLDINQTVKNINSQITQLENKLKTVNLSLDINIKSAFKEIESITSQISKNTRSSIDEELKLAEQVAKLREKSELKTRKNDRQNELKQAEAINKTLEEQYKLEKDIAIWKEKQKTNISKLASKGNIDTSELNKLKESLNKISAESTDARNEMKSFQNELARVNAEAGKSSDSILKTAMSYFTLYDAFQLTKQAAKSMVSSINDMNKSLTDIRVVTGMSSKEAEGLAASYNDLGKTLGSTTNEMLQGSVEWFRQGKTISETQELITASMVGAKLSGIESAQMTEYLTSSLNGYKMEASSAINIVDKLVAVDNAAATSVEELAIAISRTANSAQMAGVNLDDLIGYIGTVSSVTRRSAESIGESFKTILSRFQNLKLGKFSEDGEVMSDVRKALANVNIEIMASETQFKDFGVVLDELNVKWSTLTDTEKSSIATAMAGTRQRETFLVLMENMNMSAELTKTSLDSTGLAMERFGIWSESTEASLNRFKNTAEELFMNTLNSDTINNIVNISTNIISMVDKVGLLNVAFVSFAATMALVGKAKNISWLMSFPSMLEAATTGTMALTSALLTNPLFLGAVGLVGAIKLIDALTVTLDEQREKVQELEDGYNQLTSELEQLRNIENPTEGNEHKVQLLERELELQEKILAIERQKLVDKEFSAGYGNIQEDLKSLNTAIDLYQSLQDKILKTGGDASQFATLNSKEQDLVKYTQKANETLTSLMDIYDDLNPKQKEQADVMIKQAETVLKLSDDILGLNVSTNKQAECNNELSTSIDRLSIESLTEEVSSLSKEYESSIEKIGLLNRAINSLTEGQALTSDTILNLLETFPALRGEITETNGVYSISKDALLELKNQAVDTFGVMVNDQVTATNEAIANCKKRISAYQTELAMLKKLASGQSILKTIESKNKLAMGHDPIKNKEKQIKQEQDEMQKYLDLLNQIEIKELGVEIASSTGNTKKGSNISSKKPKKNKEKSNNDLINKLKKQFEADKTAILKYGEDIEKEIERVNQKIEMAELKGDTSLAESLNIELETLLSTRPGATKKMADELRTLKDSAIHQVNRASLKSEEKIELVAELIADFDEDIAEQSSNWWEYSNELIEHQIKLLELKRDILSKPLDDMELEISSHENKIKLLELANATMKDQVSAYSSLLDSESLRSEYLKLTIDDLYRQRELLDSTSKQYKTLTQYILGFESQLTDSMQSQANAKEKLIEMTYKELETSLEDSIYGSGGKKEWEKLNNKKIDRLNNELDLLKKQSDEKQKQADAEKRALEMAELRTRLENAKTQRTVQEFKKQADGSWQWEYTYDAELVADLEKQIRDKQLEEEKRAEDEKQAKKEKGLRDEISRLQREAQAKNEFFNQSKEDLLKYLQENKDNLVVNGEEVFGIVTDSMAVISDEFDVKMKLISDSLQEKLAKIKSMFQDALSMESAIGNSSGGSRGDGKPIYSNKGGSGKTYFQYGDKSIEVIRPDGTSSTVKPSDKNYSSTVSSMEKDHVKKKYKEGGSTDDTGWHWLDGELGKPERVLSAQQTAAFELGMENIPRFNFEMARLFGRMEEVSPTSRMSNAVVNNSSTPTLHIDRIEMHEVSNVRDMAKAIRDELPNAFAGLIAKSKLIPSGE